MTKDEYMKNLILQILYDNQDNPLTTDQICDEVNKRLIGCDHTYVRMQSGEGFRCTKCGVTAYLVPV